MATFNDAATAVRTALVAVTGAPPVSVRKVFAVHPYPADPTTLCVISLGTDETDVWGTTGGDQGSTGKRLQLVVSYVAPSLADLETSLSAVPDFWQAVKRALNTTTLAGVSGTWNIEIDTSEAWEKQPFGDGQEVSEMRVRVGVGENRN